MNIQAVCCRSEKLLRENYDILFYHGKHTAYPSEIYHNIIHNNNNNNKYIRKKVKLTNFLIFTDQIKNKI